MKRKGIMAFAAVGMLGAYPAAPLALRYVPFFRLRQVELVGVRYLAPDSVLAALALRPDQNVFDDTGEIQRRAVAVAGVVSATVERRLPGTLRISILERVPVAFTPEGNRLVALDGDGKRLPYDAAASGLDLPVIGRTDSLLVRTLSVVRLADSALFQDVDAARRGARGSITLDLGDRQVLFAGVPQPDDIRAVGAVRRHLASAGRRYDVLDARFNGWFVVRRAT
jgi:cell division protein FtsQ